MTTSYWLKKAQQLEAQGEKEKARWYRIRRPSGPGTTPFGTAAPIEKKLPPASLAGTLPEETPAERTLPSDTTQAPVSGLTLPTGKIDQLTLLKLALKNISTKALQSRKETATMGMIGTAGAGIEKFEEMGFDPSRMPGGFAGKIISIARQKAVAQLARERGEITEQFKTMEDILTGIQNTQKEQQGLAFQSLGLMINAGTLPSLTDDALENLSLRTKIPLEQITALRDAQKTDDEVVKSYAKAVEAGEMGLQSIPDEKTRDEVAKKVDWGKVPEETGEEELTKQKEWNMAESFVDANSDASYEDLEKALRKDTDKISDSDIKVILKSKEKEPTKKQEQYLDDNAMRKIVFNLLVKQGKEGATKTIQAGKIKTTDPKTDKIQEIKFSTEQIKRMIEVIMGKDETSKKILANPDKYKVDAKGIYEDRGFLTLHPSQWKLIYKF